MVQYVNIGIKMLIKSILARGFYNFKRNNILKVYDWWNYNKQKSNTFEIWLIFPAEWMLRQSKS